MKIHSYRVLSKESRNYHSQIVKSSKNFSNSLFFSDKEKDYLIDAKKISDEIKQTSEKTFIYAFGGSGSTCSILKNLFPKEGSAVTLIESLDSQTLASLKSLTKEDLKESHWVFISKSGETKEVLYYAKFLKKLYVEQQISLKNKITVLSSNTNSYLYKWAKEQETSIYIVKDLLSGRFSFFTLSGFLQSYLCGLSPSGMDSTSKRCQTFVSEVEKALDLILSQIEADKDNFFCSLHPQMESLACWWEKAWSESLFKKESQKPINYLRHCSFLDVKHAFLEELLVSKAKKWFWGIDIKGEEEFLDTEKQKLKLLLEEHKISNLVFSLEQKNMESVEELLYVLYKILYGIGEWTGVDIYNQPWVDYYKRM